MSPLQKCSLSGGAPFLSEHLLYKFIELKTFRNLHHQLPGFPYVTCTYFEKKNFTRKVLAAYK